MQRSFLELLLVIENAMAGMADKPGLYPVAWAKRYARNHLGEPIDMADIARRLNLSYTYFSKRFKDQTGGTFSEYLLNLRMQEAQRLLMRGMSMADAAHQVGYTNVYNFARAFTKKYGTAPAKWRRSICDCIKDGQNPSGPIGDDSRGLLPTDKG